MGKTLAVLLAVGLGGLFYFQKQHSASPEKPATSIRTTEAPKPQPQAPAQPSEHNWMKRSLDRASDVAHQSRAQTQKSQDP